MQGAEQIEWALWFTLNPSPPIRFSFLLLCRPLQILENKKKRWVKIYNSCTQSKNLTLIQYTWGAFVHWRVNSIPGGHNPSTCKPWGHHSLNQKRRANKHKNIFSLSGDQTNNLSVEFQCNFHTFCQKQHIFYKSWQRTKWLVNTCPDVI